MRPTKPLTIWGHLPITRVPMLRSPVAELEGQESGSRPLRVRSLRRPFPQNAGPQKGCPLKSRATRSHPVPLPRTSGKQKRAVLVINKRREKKGKARRKAYILGLLWPALLQICILFYKVWIVSRWLENLELVLRCVNWKLISLHIKLYKVIQFETKMDFQNGKIQETKSIVNQCCIWLHFGHIRREN